MQINDSRLVKLLIGYKEFATLDKTDELIPQLAKLPELVHLHIADNGLIQVYEAKAWAIATEREALLKKQSEVRRNRSLAHKDAINKVKARLTELNGGNDGIADTFIQNFFRMKEQSVSLIKGLVPNITPQELEAFYDTTC